MESCPAKLDQFSTLNFQFRIWQNKLNIQQTQDRL